ncbi:MAG: hypothetical protein LBM25_00945 [Bacteroidales bacterium]|jgi:hypothetical protein|nr:hypothetical protein [Bacteroidales bacterium]
MKKIVLLAFILFSLNLQSQDEWTVLKKKKHINLSFISIKDSFFKEIDNLSLQTNYPLNLTNKDNFLIYLLVKKNSNNSYSIFVDKEKEFIPSKNILGYSIFFDNTFIITGEYIEEIFQKTDKVKSFNYTITEYENGLPYLISIDDSRIAIKYIYSNGTLKVDEVIEGF